MSDKSNLEYVMDVMKEQVKELQASKKRLEGQIKELAAQAEEAELVSAKRIAVAKDQADAEIAVLQQAVRPHKDLVQQGETAIRALEEAKRKLLDETATLRADRQVQLAALDRRIQAASAKFSKLQAEEEAFRKRIALV